MKKKLLSVFLFLLVIGQFSGGRALCAEPLAQSNYPGAVSRGTQTGFISGQQVLLGSAVIVAIAALALSSNHHHGGGGGSHYH